MAVGNIIVDIIETGARIVVSEKASEWTVKVIRQGAEIAGDVVKGKK